MNGRQSHLKQRTGMPEFSRSSPTKTRTHYHVTARGAQYNRGTTQRVHSTYRDLSSTQTQSTTTTLCVKNLMRENSVAEKQR